MRRAWVALDKAHPAPYTVLEAFPDKLLAALQQCTITLTEHFTDHPIEPDGALQTFYFDALHLQRMADLLDAHSMVDVTQASATHHRTFKPGESVVCIRNVVPAPFCNRASLRHTPAPCLRPRCSLRYYADLLGPRPTIMRGWMWNRPLPRTKLQVQVARLLPTRYPHRARHRWHRLRR